MLHYVLYHMVELFSREVIKLIYNCFLTFNKKNRFLSFKYIGFSMTSVNIVFEEVNHSNEQ